MVRPQSSTSGFPVASASAIAMSLLSFGPAAIPVWLAQVGEMAPPAFTLTGGMHRQTLQAVDMPVKDSRRRGVAPCDRPNDVDLLAKRAEAVAFLAQHSSRPQVHEVLLRKTR